VRILGAHGHELGDSAGHFILYTDIFFKPVRVARFFS
jgi:hypothetical protein